MVIKLGDYREDERTLRSHVKLVHGVYLEPSLTLDQMNECHDTAHADGLTGNDGWTNLLVKHAHEAQLVLGDDVETWEW